MKKICVDDCIKMIGHNKIYIVTRINENTIFVLDQYENEHTFFINEIDKVLTRQKSLSLEIEPKTTLTQLTFF